MYRCLNIECAKKFTAQEARFISHVCACGSEVKFDRLEVQDIMQSANNLSPSIAILPKLRKLLKNEDSDPLEISDLIQADSSLSARIIRHSNSSYYTGDRLDHIEEAIQRIGFSQCLKTVGFVAAKSTFKEIVVYGIDSETAFKRSLMMALSSEAICNRLGLDAELGYLMGLTLKIGQLVINQHHVDQGEVKVFREKPVRMQHEQERFGFTFVDVTLFMLREWNFSDDIIQGIRGITTQADTGFREYSIILQRVLHDINQIVENEEEAVLKELLPTETEIGLNQDVIGNSYEEAFEQFKEFESSLNEN